MRSPRSRSRNGRILLRGGGKGRRSVSIKGTEGRERRREGREKKVNESSKVKLSRINTACLEL